MHSPPALFRLSSYVTSHKLAVVPQSGAKDWFYCTGEVQRVFTKIVEDRYKKRLFPELIQIYYWRSFYKTHEHYNLLIKSKFKDK